jgi:hypothetical protein
MKPNEHIVATAIRVEWEETTGKLFLVFEITDEKYKQDIKRNWTEDIEYQLIDKNLVKKDGE